MELVPRTPRRSGRVAKRPVDAAPAKATPAENVLMHALGLAAHDMAADEEALQELKNLFDSPLQER